MKESYNYLGKKIKNDTIFSLYGNIWGYDITLFNYYNEEEIILEPESKYIIEEITKNNNDVLMIKCKLNINSLILLNIDEITIYYYYNNRYYSSEYEIKIFGDKFVKNNENNKNIKILYENNIYELNSAFKV